MLINQKDNLGNFIQGVVKDYLLDTPLPVRLIRSTIKEQCVEESIHVVFDEADNISEGSTPDEDSGNPLNILEKQNKSDDDADSQGPGAGPKNKDSANHQNLGPSQAPLEDPNSHFSEGNDQSSEGYTSIKTGPSASQPILHRSSQKHQSSQPLDNLFSPLDSSMHTKNRAENLYDFSAFLCQIAPKNVKETLKDVDQINPMQEELHQFERSKVWYLVPHPSNKIVILTRWVYRNKVDECKATTKKKGL